jgi:hypothetical protein
LAISAVDSITPAWQHTQRQLFGPFRLGQWVRLAFVGMLAGELGSGGFRGSNFHFPGNAGASPHVGIPSFHLDPALIALAAAGLIAAFALGTILSYVSSVFRFILFDGVVTRECHIRASWSRRMAAGWRYFLWKAILFLFVLGAIGVAVGFPVAIALGAGWFQQPKEHLPVLILGGVLVFAAFMVIVIGSGVIIVLTKDFVIPQMALEDIDAFEGWRRFLPVLVAEKGAYFVYIVMKIVLGIVAGILIGIASVIVGLFFAVPAIGLGVLAFLSGKSAGLTWNAYTITLAVVVGCIVLGIFLFIVSLISVPAIVFFPAYSMYFFAGRYPRLAAALQQPLAASPGA